MVPGWHPFGSPIIAGMGGVRTPYAPAYCGIICCCKPTVGGNSLGGISKFGAGLLGVLLLFLGIILVMGWLDWLLRVAGVICIVAAVVLLLWAFMGRRREY